MSLSDTPIHHGQPSCFQCVMMRKTERTTPFCILDEQKSVTGKKIIKQIKYCVYP